MTGRECGFWSGPDGSYSSNIGTNQTGSESVLNQPVGSCLSDRTSRTSDMIFVSVKRLCSMSDNITSCCPRLSLCPRPVGTPSTW